MYIAAPQGRLGLRGAAARRCATWPLALVGLGATSHTCDSLYEICANEDSEIDFDARLLLLRTQTGPFFFGQTTTPFSLAPSFHRELDPHAGLANCRMILTR
jgi:hypothetical protein